MRRSRACASTRPPRTSTASRSIDDLTNPDVAALFDSNGDGKGELWIGAPGWASTNVEKIRAKSYGYDQTMELTEIDETVAYANLDNAIKAGDPWAGFCYTPHYVFALHDMQILEEPAYDAAKWNVTQPTDDPNWLEISDARRRLGPGLSARALRQVASRIRIPTWPRCLANVKLRHRCRFRTMTYALVIDGKIEPLAYAEQWVAENEDAVLGWMSE